ncbi:hypothetical protein FB45DRAFT_1057887 [Roridomyces roridus]|uniref:Uncharacterized protein n=1 Tax=Roridomyces roridus TaxID=1738132 RepID=A0AAD7BX79_9AGAR|nr:hypothetical protein FB45DRAFT_1057887 [Roridomyces roridus]
MSTSSSVTVTGLSVLENPRKASPRTTVFDLYTFIGLPDLEKLQGSARYYSELEASYPDVAVYYVVMTIAKMEKGSPKEATFALWLHPRWCLQHLRLLEPSAAQIFSTKYFYLYCYLYMM